MARWMQCNGAFKKKRLRHSLTLPQFQGSVTPQRTRLGTSIRLSVFSEDVVDEQGRVVAKAGVVYNPFNYIALSKSLVFIDARDEKQVSIAARYLEENPLNRVVLVGGSWRELQDRWKVKIYYDQHGKLTQHFGIKRVPAVLSQDGMKIRVDEVTQ